MLNGTVVKNPISIQTKELDTLSVYFCMHNNRKTWNVLTMLHTMHCWNWWIICEWPADISNSFQPGNPERILRGHGHQLCTRFAYDKFVTANDNVIMGEGQWTRHASFVFEVKVYLHKGVTPIIYSGTKERNGK